MDKLLLGVANAIRDEKDELIFEDWHLKRIYGGMNGIIYQATNGEHPPLAIKIRKRGERQRATREYHALKALHELSIPIAPIPYSLHTNINLIDGDVIISNWVDGDVLNDLSQIPFSTWDAVLTSFCKLHHIQYSSIPYLIDAVSKTRSMGDAIHEMEQRWEGLPNGQLGLIKKSDIRLLIDDCKKSRTQNIPPATHIRFITCDGNPTNMIHHQGRILFVDWENSGWGDPAFDIADVLVRPNCAKLSDETKRKIIGRYAEMMNLPELADRIWGYEYPMLIIWLILSSSGFGNTASQRFKGVRTFSLEEKLSQQAQYIERIEKLLKR